MLEAVAGAGLSQSIRATHPDKRQVAVAVSCKAGRPGWATPAALPTPSNSVPESTACLSWNERTGGF
ncbi:hypothetical protein ACFQT0_22025 [Hymenobacter humi]|uniref:Uncharacterized protein n=1 Tax=Hymenobacter humi TaxID=1411620 RepID=A0ABW2U9I5_9BACT